MAVCCPLHLETLRQRTGPEGARFNQLIQAQRMAEQQAQGKAPVSPAAAPPRTVRMGGVNQQPVLPPRPAGQQQAAPQPEPQKAAQPAKPPQAAPAAQPAKPSQATAGGQPAAKQPTSKGTTGERLSIPIKTIANSNMPHAAKRAVERAGGVKEARAAPHEFGASIEKGGLPSGAIRDTAHDDRVIIPGLGNRGAVVYQVKDGTLKMKTVPERRPPQ